MYIYPITRSNYNNVYFKANERFVEDKSGHLAYKTTTYFFREDTDWFALGDYLCGKYKNCDKVNVISHGCSNGMEPYSFVMNMLCFHPDDAHKFLPVIARDIDNYNIRMAKIGHYDITDMEEYLLDYYTKGRYREYLDFEPSHKFKRIGLRINDAIKNLVKFEQGDIFRDIEKMPRNNTVLFCKNFWPYLTPEKRDLLAYKLCDRFDESSVVITGDYDYSKSNVDYLLKKYAFRRSLYSGLDNVWRRMKRLRP